MRIKGLLGGRIRVQTGTNCDNNGVGPSYVLIDASQDFWVKSSSALNGPSFFHATFTWPQNLVGIANRCTDLAGA